MHLRADAKLYPLERQLTKASGPSFDLEGGDQGSNLTTSEDSQPVISYRMVLHCKPLGPIISTFKFDCPRLTLKEGPKAKSFHIKRFPTHDFL